MLIGTVTRKDFILDGSLVETRFSFAQATVVGAGILTADDDGTDALYHQGGYEESRFGTTWYYPSEAQCLSCHTEVAGRVLGLEARQLIASQRLEKWKDWGYLDQSEWVGRAFEDSSFADNGLSVADFARQYLHTNCSMCHQPGVAVVAAI